MRPADWMGGHFHRSGSLPGLLKFLNRLFEFGSAERCDIAHFIGDIHQALSDGLSSLVLQLIYFILTESAFFQFFIYRGNSAQRGDGTNTKHHFTGRPDDPPGRRGEAIDVVELNLYALYLELAYRTVELLHSFKERRLSFRIQQGKLG